MRTLPTCGTLTHVPRSGGEAEAVGSDHRTGVQDAALPDPHAGIQIDPRDQSSVRADAGAALHDAARADLDAFAELDLLLDHRQRTHGRR